MSSTARVHFESAIESFTAGLSVSHAVADAAIEVSASAENSGPACVTTVVCAGSRGNQSTSRDDVGRLGRTYNRVRFRR